MNEAYSPSTLPTATDNSTKPGRHRFEPPTLSTGVAWYSGTHRPLFDRAELFDVIRGDAKAEVA